MRLLELVNVCVAGDALGSSASKESRAIKC